MDDAEFRPKWKNRRRVIFLTLLFCACVVIYSVVSGRDTEVIRTAVRYSYYMAGGVILGYVFGAVWDDKNVLELLKNKL